MVICFNSFVYKPYNFVHMLSVGTTYSVVRGIFSRSDMTNADFASNLRGRLARGSSHFHTPCVFVVMRHVSRLCVVKNVYISNDCHIFSRQPLMVYMFVSVYKLPSIHQKVHNLLHGRTTFPPVPSSTRSVPETPSLQC